MTINPYSIFLPMPTPGHSALYRTPPGRLRSAGDGIPLQSGLFVSLSDEEIRNIANIIGRGRQISRGDGLYREKAPFASLYLIRVGHFKTFHVDVNGQQQITGFPMAGDLLGIDAIATGFHSVGTVALEDSLVCEIPYSGLERMFAQMPALLLNFHRMLSREIVRGQGAIFSLCKMRAEQRLATFLLDLSSRYGLLGYSPIHFYLRMSRNDIANSLGLTIESISRLLSQFDTQGLVRLNGRELEIVDMPALQALAKAR